MQQQKNNIFAHVFKKAFIVAIITFSLVAHFSNHTNANDCNIVSVNDDWIFKSLENRWYNNLLPKDAMVQVLINLKNFCCNQEVFQDASTNENCKKDSIIKTDWIYPSSAYIYDHILDISMRRLDAKQKNDNWADLIYWLEPDEKWLEWREFITKHANSKNGSIPLQISTKFKETREAWINSVTAWNPSSDTLWKNNVFENYSERKLVEKYKWVCETSIYLSLKYPGWEKDKTKLNIAYQQCEIITNERIEKEFNYTKAVLMQKGNKLLHNNVKSYLDTYFSQNKLVALQQLVFNIKNTFNEVNKTVLELVPNCN